LVARLLAKVAGQQSFLSKSEENIKGKGRNHMFQTHSHRQGSIELVHIEDLVPQDHLLRKIDATIDFSFIVEKTRPLYCEDNGRPCVDPVMLFKMLFIGYLYGIRSERRLVEEVQVNVAYRWFVGLSLTDKVPHATTFSQN
jgi:transposase